MMALESTKEEDIFSKLKSSESSVAYDGLLQIRSNITQTKEGYKTLRENKVLRDLVNLLHKPNEKILDVTLSILGNCCLDSDCRNEVVSHGIVGPLATVIQNIARDSIQCRACRLIGNLAQEPCIAELLHNERITASIVAVLVSDSGSSTGTRQMAVRALRMLWSVTSQREQMLNCQVVRAVALLLPVNQKNSGEQHLLLAIVKALAAFTNHRSDECAQQVQGSGSGYQHLVSLVANSHLKHLALACICNLCYTSSSRPALGSVGTVETIIEELFSDQQNNTGLRTEMVLALCYLCRESVNRAKIRHAGGLPLMLRIIRNCSTATVRSSVFNALVQFLYDENSLQVLLKEGLVAILVDKVVDFVKANGRVHSKISVCLEESRKSGSYSENVDPASDNNKQHSPGLRKSCLSDVVSDTSANTDRDQEVPRRRFRATSPSYQAVVQEQGNTARCLPNITCSGHCRDPSPDYSMVGDWSPASPSSMYVSPDASPSQRGTWIASPSHTSTSDGLSPPSSPHALYATTFDHVDCPEAYSPVCYDLGDDEDDCDWHSDHDDGGGGGDDDFDYDYFDEEEEEKEEEAAYIQSRDIREDKHSEHVVFSPDSKQQERVADDKCLCDTELDAALILLSRISHMDNPVDELAAHSTLAALIDYITLIRDPQPRASRTLFRIVRNHHYFMSLLLQRFVLTVQSRLCQPQHTNCQMCGEFESIGLLLFWNITIFSHSGFGEGELAHHLLKGEVSVQRLLAVSIPYVVRIQTVLWKLLVECNALKILVQVLDSSNSTEHDGLLKYVPLSLKQLAADLGICNPYNHTERTHDRDDEHPEHFDEASSGSVTIQSTTKVSDDAVFLVLDDGSSVQVSKMHLSSQSPMFEAMFRGDFKESNEDYVPLPGISHYCLINLLRIMKLGHVPSYIPGIDLGTSLELVAVLDRFLVPGCEQLTHMIVTRFLSHSTAVKIYFGCMEAGDVSHFHTLRLNTVRYVLTSSVTHRKTENMFQGLLCSPYRKQVLADITDILQDRLNSVKI